MPERVSLPYGEQKVQLLETIELFAQSPEANLETYQYFKGESTHRDAQKEAFLADDTAQSNPVLDLSEVSVDWLHSRANAMTQLLGVAEQNTEASTEDGSALYEMIGERAAGLYFLLTANRVADMPSTHPWYSTETHRLQELNNSLYGLPTIEDFHGVLAYELDQAHLATLGAEDPALQQIVEDYRALLPELPEEHRSELYRPARETIEHYHQVVTAVYAEVLEAIEPLLDDDTQYGPQEMVKAFSKALEVLGADGWDAEIDDGGTNLNTSQADRRIYIGSKRASSSGKTLKGLVLHEAGVHAFRRVLGERTDNPLLWNIGLAGYYDTEEGLGKFVEAALSKEDKPAGLGYYLNIGLSVGIDGQPRDFRELFEIEWRKNVVHELAQGKQDIDIEKLRNKAYNSVLRIRRGMPADVKGATFTKDMAYFNGSAAIWRYLEQNLLSEDEFLRVLTGKHDPTRPDHRAMVEKALN